MRRIVLLLTVGVLAPLGAASAASASKCGAVIVEGAIASNIITAKTTCTVGRAVARSYATGPFMGKKRAVRDQLGRTWKCRVTQAATGTDPGSISRTKVRCTRSSQIVRMELRT